MGSKTKKINKLLDKACEYLTTARVLKSGKKYEKALTECEKFCQKAYGLARADISKGVNSDYTDIIHAEYMLSSVLFVQKKYEEARTYLEDAKRVPDFYANKYAMAIDAYYGTILSYSEEYEESAEIFENILESAAQNPAAADVDKYAISHAYSMMLLSFAFSDKTHKHEHFILPLDNLKKLMENGYSVEHECMAKAAYFRAAYLTFRINNDCAITQGDVSDIIKNAELCMKYCKDNGDFFMAAAMKLKAFALSRDLKLYECLEYCPKVLSYCKSYGDKIHENTIGNIHDIAADINILIAIISYRLGFYKDSIKYFTAALEELKLYANGRKYGSIGFNEFEAIVVRVPAAEKAAFIYEYLGLSMRECSEKYSFDEWIDMFKQSINNWLSISSEPQVFLKVAALYDAMSHLCEKESRADEAKEYAECSQKNGITALVELKKLSANQDEYKKCTQKVCALRQLALGRGCFELNADYILCELLMNEKPYVEPNVIFLGDISYQIGEFYRIIGQHNSAIQYYDKAKGYFCHKNGAIRIEYANSALPIYAMRSMTECLIKTGNMKGAYKAFERFEKYVYHYAGDRIGSDDYNYVARSAKSVGLNPAKLAEYQHKAALKSREEGNHGLQTALLFNQEGISWYNASPESDDFDEPVGDEKFLGKRERKKMLEARFAKNELLAFEAAYEELQKCDQNDEEVIDLLPPLLANIGECYMRSGDSRCMDYYNKALNAFKRDFETKLYANLDENDKKSHLYDYASCNKSIAEIYTKQNNIEKAIEYFTNAIDTFSMIDGEAAYYQLSFCLNARGCLNYRLGKYQNEVDDLTKAIKNRSKAEGSEFSLAVMYKNRAEAYEELGNEKMRTSDLEASIKMLDQSIMPDELKHSTYGEHYYALALCYENSNRVDDAVESLKNSLRHYEALDNPDIEEEDMKALCHFRLANCFCKRDEHEYYGALSEYSAAINLLENMPKNQENNERLGAVLHSRGSLYELFRQLELAQKDFERAEKLGQKRNAD